MLGLNAERAPHRVTDRLARAGLTALQLTGGAVGGWFVSWAVLLCGYVACRVVGIPPTIGDLVVMGVMLLWAASSVVGACAFYNRRVRWVAAFIGFSLATVVFAFFAVVLVIPFGASMRDFD